MRFGFSIAAPALLLAACASQPLEERYTAAELHKMYAEPAACRGEYGLGGWHRDGEKCAREGSAERQRIHEAMERQHAADLAAAPACVKELRAPRRFLEELGVNPDRPDAMAEIITRGAVIASSTGRCAAELCAWRSKFEPDEESPYCAMAKPRWPASGEGRRSRNRASPWFDPVVLDGRLGHRRRRDLPPDSPISLQPRAS